jgi:RNA polymerase sigma-70 factor, ECF subfamily
MLDPGAILTGDGGGLVGAAPHPIEGGERVARFAANLARTAPCNVRLLERTVNGQPGLVKQEDGVTLAVYAFEIAGDQITRIWAILNPGKLRPWATG